MSEPRRLSPDELEAVRKTYEEEGFVIVDGLIPPPSMGRLREGAQAVTDRTRAGKWPHRRTVGRQFPPWPKGQDSPDIWGVSHVMHPDLDRPEFAAFYASRGMLDVGQALMGCARDELMMALFQLLVEPKDHNYALSWHRDTIKSSATDEEEKRELETPRYGVQWNAALYADDCLLGVPRSHLRVRTTEERHATSASDGSLPMPGGKVLHLDAGQVIFYDNQILHRGTYDSSRKRATMHGSYQDSRESPSRGSGVLQHGTEWMVSDAFRRSLGDAPKESLDMLDRALAWGERARAVGFSYAQADI